MTTPLTFHPVADLFPLMDDKALADLAEDIKTNGLLEPIWVHPDDGRIVDGRNRYKACLAAGVRPMTRKWDGVGSLVAFVLSLNLKRRHLDESQRAMIGARAKPMFEEEARARMLAGKPDPSANWQQGGRTADLAAGVVNVSPRAIYRADDVQKHGTPELVAAVDSGAASVSAAAMVAKLSPEEQRAIVADGSKAIIAAAKEIREHDGDEWYTPPEHVELARAVLGKIDLDPASCDVAQGTVKAERFYTKDDDGLARAWRGNVWCNPPYSYPLVEQFTDKMLAEYDAGNVSAAIFLVNNCTDTAWFHRLLSRFPACFTKGRVRFVYPGLERFATRQGQAFFYLGKQTDEFCREFGRIGTIVRAVA